MSSTSPPDVAPGSWLKIDTESEFSLSNIPFGICSFHHSKYTIPVCCTIVGSTIIDLSLLAQAGLLDPLDLSAQEELNLPLFSPTYIFSQPTLNAFIEQPKSVWTFIRNRLIQLLSTTGINIDDRLQKNPTLQKAAFHDTEQEEQTHVKMHLPVTITDYTDFYSSREHATNVGTMFRSKENALNPNWTHLPVGYHGRASSIFVSGQDVIRPCGQVLCSGGEKVELKPTEMLDFELEVAFFVGGPKNEHGHRIDMGQAADRIFGFVLMNDWSARDVQKWEYVPLGPFGSKNFATTISPWIVTSMALEPYTCSTSTKEQTNPIPLDYLKDPNYSSYNIELSVTLQTTQKSVTSTDEDESTSTTSTVICKSNYANLYWNARQQLVHHSVTGCIMNAGDLLASGTISGQTPDSFGSMLELSWRGTKPIKLNKGCNDDKVEDTERSFLKDGDTVILKGVASPHSNITGAGSCRIGFGSCAGKILPAILYKTKDEKEQSSSSSSMTTTSVNAQQRYTDFKLYGFWRSSSTWRVRIALAAKAVQYETVSIDVTQHEMSDASNPNPMKQIPILECVDTCVDGEKKIVRISQSMAIIDFLESIFPQQGSSLFPMTSDPMGRALTLELAEIVNSSVQPLQNLSILRHIDELGVKDTTSPTMNKGHEFGKYHMKKGLLAMEALTRTHQSSSTQRGGKGPFLIGTFSPTIADVYLIPQLYNARTRHFFEEGELVSICPTLLEAEKAALTHAWFTFTHPEKIQGKTK